MNNLLNRLRQGAGGLIQRGTNAVRNVVNRIRGRVSGGGRTTSS